MKKIEMLAGNARTISAVEHGKDIEQHGGSAARRPAAMETKGVITGTAAQRNPPRSRPGARQPIGPGAAAGSTDVGVLTTQPEGKRDLRPEFPNTKASYATGQPAQAVQRNNGVAPGTTTNRQAAKSTTRTLSQRPLPDIDPQHVRSLAAAQLTVPEIAATLKCDEGRLTRDFAAEIAQGYCLGNGAIKRKVHKLALVDEVAWAIRIRYQALFAAEAAEAQRERVCPMCEQRRQVETRYSSMSDEEHIDHFVRLGEALLDSMSWSPAQIDRLKKKLQAVEVQIRLGN